MSGVLHVERIIEAEPSAVWATMVDPVHARTWLEATDFRPRVGHRFTARVPRGPGFDGVVHAEVLEVDAPRRLRLWWSGGPVSGEVRLELHPTAGGGTRVTIDQTGFDRPQQALLAPVFTALWADRLAFGQGLVAGAATGAGAAAASGLGWLIGLVGVGVMVALILAFFAFFEFFSASVSSPSAGIPAAVGLGQPSPEPEESRSVKGPPGDDLPAAPSLVAASVHPRGPVQVDEDAGHALNPVFSTSGEHVAFEVNTYDGDGGALYIARVSGAEVGEARRLRLPSIVRQGGPSFLSSPAWHPQGLVLFEGHAGGEVRLYFAQPGGAAAAEMIPSSSMTGNLMAPALDRAGQHLLYTSDRSGADQVMLYSRGTNTHQPLSTTGGAKRSPVFSADGRRVAWTHLTERGAIIEVVDRDTGEVVDRITHPGRDALRPVFAGGDLLYCATTTTLTHWRQLEFPIRG